MGDQRSPADTVVSKILRDVNRAVADPSRGIPPRPPAPPTVAPIVPSMSRSANLVAFPEAIRRVMEGVKMTREDWKDDGEYIFLNGGRLRVMREGGLLYDLIVSDGDLFGVDWRPVRVSDVPPSTTMEPAENPEGSIG